MVKKSFNPWSNRICSFCKHCSHFWADKLQAASTGDSPSPKREAGRRKYLQSIERQSEQGHEVVRDELVKRSDLEAYILCWGGLMQTGQVLNSRYQFGVDPEPTRGPQMATTACIMQRTQYSFSVRKTFQGRSVAIPKSTKMT